MHQLDNALGVGLVLRKAGAMALPGVFAII
jgi:hypothetical protein